MGLLGRVLTLRFRGITGVRILRPPFFEKLRTPTTLSTVFCSSLPPPPVIEVQYRHGRPVLHLMLPSRGEACRFPLRPMMMTVADFLSDIQNEDPGVTTTAILTADGNKVSSSTLLDSVLNNNFQLVINDTTYSIISPSNDELCHEHLTGLEDVKMVVHLLYTALHLPEHQRLKERQLLERLDTLRQLLQPLERERAGLEARAEAESMWYVWGGLAYMSVQGGFMGWLTWCVFSWDVMEPVTYFITYTWSMGLLAYFLLTQQGNNQQPVSVANQEFMYADAKDRHFLSRLHRAAAREGFDITRYNKLKEEVLQVENDLRRLRNPIKLQLPVEQVQG
ncbi:calcium uniporter regulatory subunit MCUb, mitochondrial-like isoform X1 [Alosa pseudoharengus]|uniref:calcium uniporter regulatory subunit MCUb, mitochondrial-like isoform X1 n=2 Tax=Alosa pseudoharengus TaxID=34774 RepID=UPI003F8A452A